MKHANSDNVARALLDTTYAYRLRGEGAAFDKAEIWSMRMDLVDYAGETILDAAKVLARFDNEEERNNAALRMAPDLVSALRS